MILSNEVKDLITKEFEEFKAQMYAGKTKEERQKLGQFFTPADISIQMIERFNCDSLAGKKILDPACGSGNLLAACLLAGADPDKVFGNDYDQVMVTPRLLTVKLPLANSAAEMVPSRPALALAFTALEMSRKDIFSAPRRTGTIRPFGVSTATPRLTTLK